MLRRSTSTGAADAGVEPKAPTSIEWIGEFAQRWLEAWNSHEVERLLELMTEDIEYRDDAWRTTMHGHAEVREYLQSTWRATPDMTVELLSGPYVIPGQPRAAFHWRSSGTHMGRLDPPGFAATGHRWKVDGADFHEYRDERVSQLRIAFDMMSVSRQLGLMPAAGGRAERALGLAQRSVLQARQAIQRRRRQPEAPPATAADPPHQ